MIFLYYRGFLVFIFKSWEGLSLSLATIWQEGSCQVISSSFFLLSGKKNIP